MEIKLPLAQLLTPGSRITFPHNSNYQMLMFGRELRNKYIYQYPLLEGALSVYREMVVSREWKVSGKPRSVARCVESLNKAKTVNDDGTVEYGFEQFLLRLVNDYNPIGRIVFHFKEGEFQYLDPTELFYQEESRSWRDSITQDEYPANELSFYHPIPIGSSGQFISPLFHVIPTAQLAWLIREHDMAATDGRKIRDIKIVVGKEMLDQIQQAINTSAALWTDGDVEKHGIPVIAIEDPPQGLTAQDLIGTLGLAHIPPDMDRKNFQFVYANEIANAIGLAIRNFWNMEMGTNRALEDVQEARQVNKGPAFFVRTIQRMLREPVKYFGSDTRMGFIEEIDSASRKTDAEVVSLYMDGVNKLITALMMAQQGQGRVLVKPVVGWLQSINLLPPDVDIIDEDFVNTMVTSDGVIAPQNGSVIQSSEESPTKNPTSPEDIRYGEVTMSLDGRILDRREKIFTMDRILRKEMELDKEWKQEALDTHTPISLIKSLSEARIKNLGIFKSEVNKIDLEEEEKVFSKAIEGKQYEEVTIEEHRQIKDILKKYGKTTSFIQQKSEIIN